MSRLYGTIVPDMAKTNATRRSRKEITAAAQSWEGSVITDLWVTDEGEHRVAIRVASCSSTTGRTLWSGTLAELVEARELKTDVVEAVTSRG